MKIKRQFGEITRIKVGALVYVVKMLKAKITIEEERGKYKEIIAVAPNISISFFSSLKRGKVFSNWRYRSYKQLSNEEVERLDSGNAIFELTKVAKRYLDKYETNYLMTNPYKDSDLARKMRVLERMLNRLGFTKIYTFPKKDGAIYSRAPEQVYKVADYKIYRRSKP